MNEVLEGSAKTNKQGVTVGLVLGVLGAVLVLFSQPLHSYGVVLLVFGVIVTVYALLLPYFVGMRHKGKKP